MKKLIYILPAFIGLFLTNCNSGETTSENESTTQESSDEKVSSVETLATGSFSIDPSSVTLKWTAFKLAEKVGVDGEFKSYTLTGYTDNANSITEMMTGSEITMEVSSTKTGDEARDGKIINSFFGSMQNTEQIKATLISMEGSEEGTAIIRIMMNDQSLEQEMQWIYREDLNTFIIKGVINIPDWNAQQALDELTKVCEEKHKGTGDKAVTWPDVEINATVKVNFAPASEV